MDKDTIDGISRAISSFVAGWLLGGWRGAIASVIIAGLATSLVRDYVKALAQIAKISKGS